MANSINIIGLMSGTSVDGLDICYISFPKNKIEDYEIISCKTYDYPIDLKNELINVIKKDDEKIKHLDLKFGEFIGLSVNKFISENKLPVADLISSHGHTVFHEPNIGKTLQIGNGNIIKKITGIKTINNFREQDVKLGGQGAPLVPIGDKLLFKKFKYCLNLGGFVNISIKNGDEIFAYDICPLNTVLNIYSKKIGYEYDHDGNLSSKGTVDENLLNELNQLSYYFEKYPKSLGLEFVIEKVLPIIDSYSLSESDVLATYIRHVAFQISNNIMDDEKVLISGGGSFNKTLIQSLRNHNINLVIPESQILNYKESLIFGLLGYLRINNKINCLRSVTGASKDHSSGDIYD